MSSTEKLSPKLGRAVVSENGGKYIGLGLDLREKQWEICL